MQIVLTANAAWNIWNFRRCVVRACLEQGDGITVISPVDNSVAMIEALGCKHVPFAMDAKGLNPISGIALYRGFRRAFRQAKPDVVLSYTIKNNIFGALAAKSCGVPFIPNVTGLGTAFLSGGLLLRVACTLYRRAFRNLPVVFFQNEDDRALFLEKGLITAAQARLLPGSGIDLQHFAAAPYGAADDAPVFLMIARLLRDKGVLEFVEAARQIKAEMPAARFQLLGAADAENRTAISAEVLDGWVREGVIEYLGTTSDVRPHIAASSCVVLPSYREGAPRTLIEAAAMARPLIATDVPGCRSVVRPDISGFLCAPQSADSLAVALRRFLALSQTERVAMGQSARAHMEQSFDEALIVSAYRAAIAEVTKGRA
jgi:glycosyltransferase involved in cell wall biosynthesis